MLLLTVRTTVLALALLSIGAPLCCAYSVLGHEQIVDLAWKDYLVPLLRARFPGASDAQLAEAHAYAYGGSLVHDMGYYPHGNKYFSDLVHYVRSGDFVESLLRNARTLDEYAFALGALSHYVADSDGHPAINRSVGILFPKLQAKYGNPTYEDGPTAHIRTEFGFDVEQVAKGNYTSDQYHDFIGFAIATPLLQRAFHETYALDLADVFPDVDQAIGSFRHAVYKLIPQFTRVALRLLPKDKIPATPQTNAHKQFAYHLSRAEYEREFGAKYYRPGLGAKILALLVRILPKIGPLKAMSFKVPTPDTEKLYVASVDRVMSSYEARLKGPRSQQLENRDFDTGKPTAPGEYNLTDKAYAKLLRMLDERHFRALTPELRSNILQFFAQAPATMAVRRDKEEWTKTMRSLQALKGAPVAVAER